MCEASLWAETRMHDAHILIRMRYQACHFSIGSAFSVHASGENVKSLSYTPQNMFLLQYILHGERLITLLAYRCCCQPYLGFWGNLTCGGGAKLGGGTFSLLTGLALLTCALSVAAYNSHHRSRSGFSISSCLSLVPSRLEQPCIVVCQCMRLLREQ